MRMCIFIMKVQKTSGIRYRLLIVIPWVMSKRRISTIAIIVMSITKMPDGAAGKKKQKRQQSQRRQQLQR